MLVFFLFLPKLQAESLARLKSLPPPGGDGEELQRPEGSLCPLVGKGGTAGQKRR